MRETRNPKPETRTRNPKPETRTRDTRAYIDAVLHAVGIRKRHRDCAGAWGLRFRVYGSGFRVVVKDLRVSPRSYAGLLSYNAS
jgi:hypothetical protein